MTVDELIAKQTITDSGDADGFVECVWASHALPQEPTTMVAGRWPRFVAGDPEQVPPDSRAERRRRADDPEP